MDVLGFPLQKALAFLESEGKPVHLIEVSSRTGSKGNDARVIKVNSSAQETVLYWARFQTTVEHEDKVQG